LATTTSEDLFASSARCLALLAADFDGPDRSDGVRRPSSLVDWRESDAEEAETSDNELRCDGFRREMTS